MSPSAAPAEKEHAAPTLVGPAAHDHPDDRPPRQRLMTLLRTPRALDIGVCLLFLIAAAWLTHGLWPDPATRVLALNQEDQALYEWFIAYDARILFGDFSLVTDRLNAPDGVNLLANTSVIAIGAVLAPITLAFGAPVTFAVVTAANLALTAIGWYFLYSRGLRARRVVAAVGGAFCGFAPAMISQSNSHLHMTAQWLVPLMLWCVVRMARASDPAAPDHARIATSAVALAALVAAQLFVGEEVLFLTALTMVLITIGYAVVRPVTAARLAPRFLAGMLLATGLATAALAYPLWVQFAGPQHVPNGPFSPAYFSADLASFAAFSGFSIGGSAESLRLTTGAAEYNTFLGAPLLIVALACVVWLRRHPMAVPIAFAAVVMAWLSLGPQLVINGQRTDRPGIYKMLEGLPIVDGALPQRFAVALVPLFATLLVLALSRALEPGTAEVPRLAVICAITVALIPLLPTPLPTTSRAPVPAFISQGHWRSCVEPGGVLLPVPLPTPPKPDPMRWAAYTNVAFGLPEGFFIGPYAARGRASMGTWSRPTSYLLKEVERTGDVPQIGDGERANARNDLRHWGVSCVALAAGPREEQLRATLEALLGQGERVADTWTWTIRPAE